jgi:hypothetical protein
MPTIFETWDVSETGHDSDVKQEMYNCYIRTEIKPTGISLF